MRLKAAILTLALGIALVATGAPDCLAQSLFRAPAEGDVGAQATGIAAYIATKQAAFYNVLIEALMRFRQSPSAGLWLVVTGFLYGIFHAAGPGHGKMVLGSYMLASRTAARRGALLALASSLVQGVAALVAVGVLAIALNATGARISESVWTLERISYGILTLFGLWMLWSKSLRPFIKERKAVHHHHDDHDHGHDHHHHHDGCCDHAHLPDASAMESRVPLMQALTIVGSIGIRPCSGAIIVLVFALSQGMIWPGALAVFAISLGTAITVSAIVLGAAGGRSAIMKMTATNPRLARLAQKGLETFGAVLILAFGLILLIGTFGPRPALF